MLYGDKLYGENYSSQGGSGGGVYSRARESLTEQTLSRALTEVRSTPKDYWKNLPGKERSKCQDPEEDDA